MKEAGGMLDNGAFRTILLLIIAGLAALVMYFMSARDDGIDDNFAKLESSLQEVEHSIRADLREVKSSQQENKKAADTTRAHLQCLVQSLEVHIVLDDYRDSLQSEEIRKLWNRIEGIIP